MILRFEEDFPGAKVFKLEENYRSSQTILAAANELVQNNPNRSAKTLFTKRAEGEKITAFQAESERAEARYVMEKIKEHVREGAAYRDFLVLYRTNAQSRYFEEGFLAEGIPYRVVGGVGFYARTEVKDMLVLPALHRQSVRRGRVPAHRQRAAPRHRPADARLAARKRRTSRRPVGRHGGVRRRTCSSARCPRSSANWSASPS